MPSTRILATIAILSALPAYAGTLTPNSGPAEIAPASVNSPAAQAFKAADDRMMQRMGTPLTGNADQDFVSEMLPHHRGAVEMAKVELQYGKDPELRRLAAAIVNAQNQEIAQMDAWRAKHP